MPKPINFRVVIDVNVFVSYFLGTLTRERLDRILLDERVKLLLSDALLEELNEVLNRPKFTHLIKSGQINRLMKTLGIRSEKINVRSHFAVSRDQDDDYLLMLCLDGNADFLITGDQDLLVLNPFDKTKILTIADFCQVIDA